MVSPIQQGGYWIYQGDGACIYCRETGKLSREHVVPYGLGGRIIIKGASCRKCAKITGELERKILRGPMLNVRTRSGMPTRNPDERPKRLPFRMQRENEILVEDLPVGDHPGLVSMPTFGEPALFSPNFESGTISIVGWDTIRTGELPEIIMARYGATKFEQEESWPIAEFARFLGKVGHSLVCAKFGRDAIAEPLCLPSVLGEDNEVGRWVGSSRWIAAPGEPQPTQQLLINSQWFENSIDESDRRLLAVVFFKPFAKMAMSYKIAVGWLDPLRVSPSMLPTRDLTVG